jgi:hypothetical protein
MFQLLGIVRLPSSIVVATTLLLAASTGILTIFSIELLVECSPVIYNPSTASQVGTHDNCPDIISLVSLLLYDYFGI